MLAHDDRAYPQDRHLIRGQGKLVTCAACGRLDRRTQVQATDPLSCTLPAEQEIWPQMMSQFAPGPDTCPVVSSHSRVVAMDGFLPESNPSRLLRVIIKII